MMEENAPMLPQTPPPEEEVFFKRLNIHTAHSHSHLANVLGSCCMPLTAYHTRIAPQESKEYAKKVVIMGALGMDFHT